MKSFIVSFVLSFIFNCCFSQTLNELYEIGKRKNSLKDFPAAVKKYGYRYYKAADSININGVTYFNEIIYTKGKDENQLLLSVAKSKGGSIVLRFYTFNEGVFDGYKKQGYEIKNPLRSEEYVVNDNPTLLVMTLHCTYYFRMLRSKEYDSITYGVELFIHSFIQ